MNPPVALSVTPCPTYEPEPLRRAMTALLAPLGGLRRFVSRGDVVLLKPNLLAARTRDRHVCTHPEVVLAVAEAALDAGAARVLVGDSPGFGTTTAVLRKLGLVEPLRERGVEIVDFDQPVAVMHSDPHRYRRFEVERQVLEADRIINLVKVKTHAQMMMTLAVKNTFGYVVGTRKAAWHLEAGRDAELFATMLLDLHTLAAPSLHIADGIVMMEGNGPGSGTPRELGLLVAGTEAVAFDRAICDILSVPRELVPTLKVAAQEGFGTPEDQPVAWYGATLEEVRIGGIDHPVLSPPGRFLTPRPLLSLTRRLVEVRPVVDPGECTGCRLCQQACPADAIDLVATRGGRQVARIRPAPCIHCYCCQELCPEGAIAPRRGFIRSFLRAPSRS